jgi:hypothetical protein
MSLRRFALTAILLVTTITVPVLAQGPTHDRVNFTINVPFELKKSDIVLQPGNYVLLRIDENNPNLFALYRDSTRHSPIAMITTSRIEHFAGKVPGKTRLLMDTDETSAQSYAVLEGWNVPGKDGWEMISTVTRRHGISSSR